MELDSGNIELNAKKYIDIGYMPQVNVKIYIGYNFTVLIPQMFYYTPLHRIQV